MGRFFDLVGMPVTAAAAAELLIATERRLEPEWAAVGLLPGLAGAAAGAAGLLPAVSRFRQGGGGTRLIRCRTSLRPRTTRVACTSPRLATAGSSSC